jgi:heat shock transcription factor
MIDLSAITNGIAAIQRTQASIGADLKALQSSNELLWREAAVQREKNQKHQETIDLIVTFLERLFGTEGEGLKGLKEAMRRGGLGSKREDTGDDNTGSSKKRKRLGIDRMISDGRDEHVGEDGQIVEISGESTQVKSVTCSDHLRYRIA